MRRFAETARLPVKPVWDVARETVELTAEAWKVLPQKELLAATTLKIIDQQIQRVTASTMAPW